MSAENHQFLFLRQLLNQFLIQDSAARRHIKAPFSLCLHSFHSPEHRIGQQYHAGAASKWIIVCPFMFVHTVIPNIGKTNIQNSFFACFSQYTACHCRKHLRKQGQNINVHNCPHSSRRPSGSLTRIVFCSGSTSSTNSLTTGSRIFLPSSSRIS